MRQKSEYQERRITARKAALACSSLTELEELVVRLDKVEKSLIELVQKGRVDGDVLSDIAAIRAIFDERRAELLAASLQHW